MSWTISFEGIDALSVGTVGDPGERVFYFQIRADGKTVALKAEKQQVAGLADFIEETIGDALVFDEPSPSDMELQHPVLAEWVVGQIGVGYDAGSGVLAMLIEEIPVAVNDGPEPDPDAPLGTVEMRVTVGQARAFIARARELVAAGRPPGDDDE